MVANALVGRKLDFSNSLFKSLSAADLSELQTTCCNQNILAHIIRRATEYSHITHIRKALQWLPISQRCIFKLLYKFLHSDCPKYLSPCLKVRQSAYNTQKSQADGVMHLFRIPSGSFLSFAYDALKNLEKDR